MTEWCWHLFKLKIASNLATSPALIAWHRHMDGMLPFPMNMKSSAHAPTQLTVANHLTTLKCSPKKMPKAKEIVSKKGFSMGIHSKSSSLPVLCGALTLAIPSVFLSTSLTICIRNISMHQKAFANAPPPAMDQEQCIAALCCDL